MGLSRWHRSAPSESRAWAEGGEGKSKEFKRKKQGGEGKSPICSLQALDKRSPTAGRHGFEGAALACVSLPDLIFVILHLELKYWTVYLVANSPTSALWRPSCQLLSHTCALTQQGETLLPFPGGEEKQPPRTTGMCFFKKQQGRAQHCRHYPSLAPTLVGLGQGASAPIPAAATGAAPLHGKPSTALTPTPPHRLSPEVTATSCHTHGTHPLQGCCSGEISPTSCFSPM